MDVISQYVMVSCFLHLLIHHILRDQQSSLPELGGDLRHSLSSLTKVLELPHQLQHLNRQWKLSLKSWQKILQCHGLHTRRSHNVTNLLPLVASSIPQKAGCEPHLRPLRVEARCLRILHVDDPSTLAIGSLAPKNFEDPQALNYLNERVCTPNCLTVISARKALRRSSKSFMMPSLMVPKITGVASIIP